ncbi:MAG: hypothetical protein FRX48_07902 [Lasallia pustulata]|uniref:Sds3-like n=1 Tax=Lasallia pustulata TaxID=136370 RepID=A0A5M8PGY0_9LECA|nr:MAG: hypothetical protein FRX48_07902 [Lasallia pustulata]
MAYSPSPQISPTMHASSVSRPHRLSATPPLPQTLSKRDKRRNAISERLNELITTFAENRDHIYRQQLHALQVDMGYMLRADPYQDKPLDDLADDITDEMVAAMASNPNSFVRGGQGAARMPMPEVELPPSSGKWASVFAQEVNNALEQRDASLTLLAERHSRKMQSIHQDKLYRVKVALDEHKLLTEALRERLLQTLGQKKARLLKEKDQSDIAEINALFLHPNQFSIINPGSPGGAQSNRKTRHTRHRLDADDAGVAGESGKRKRKAAIEDYGSPGPSMRIIDMDSTNPWKAAHARQTAHQMTAPLYSVDRLFTEKELSLFNQSAHVAARRYFASKRQNTHHNSNGMPLSHDSGTATHGNATDAEDNAAGSGNGTLIDEGDNEDNEVAAGAALAPGMDRTANQSFHATRSTRATNISGLNLLGDLAGLAIPAIAVSGPRDVARGGRNPDDLTANGPPRLDAREADEDLALMQAAIEEDGKGDGSINQRLIDELAAQGPLKLGAAQALGLRVGMDGGAVRAANNALCAGAMSRRPSLTGFSDVGGVAMSRTGSANAGGSAMARSVSAAGYANGGGGKRSRLR